MKTIQTRFGEVTYDPDKVVRFPEGLIGFEHLRDFVVVPRKNGNDPLFCLQSAEEPHIAFLFIDPILFFQDYKVEPDQQVLFKLGISAKDSYYILTTITFHQDETVTLNLLAPIIYTPQTNRAVQIILDGSGYLSKTPLPGING